jgi:hypothetical protein
MSLPTTWSAPRESWRAWAAGSRQSGRRPPRPTPRSPRDFAVPLSSPVPAGQTGDGRDRKTHEKSDEKGC